ncbi:hypothetical protein QCB44_05310 [Thiomicrorhabdus sp. zzn3]|uniref:hypothetical protein n=1 Tax=Thiomicrorhabdus sp. zzn3 TaxID=3039775 RepID=UPI002437418B|nr:hypothetical protein [Thiomicrorhabdus sp. zzn3]MDG6778118.1 hypothetical protein [Thiomicrorhabdus sp. zzn3]
MKPVIQEQKTGCAIASAAAVAGISYQHAKSVANGLGIYAEDDALWSETDHMLRLLGRLGVSVEAQTTPFSSWEALPDCALLAIKWHLDNSKPYWHWVVFVRDGDGSYVLDSKKSLKNHVRTDFGRMQPKWFIKVNLD